MAGQRLTTSGACGECPPGVRCLHLKGTLVTTYSVAVTITMPGVPDGLTRCEAAHVRAFLRNVLLPHEQDHRRRFKTYDGQTRHRVDVTGCSQEELTQKVADMQAAEAADREAAAKALSGAVDPFERTVDCSACEEGG